MSRTAQFARTAGRALLHAVLLVAALTLTGAAINRALPFPEVPIVESKLAHLAQHRDDYDTLFIGSSRMAYQILPSIFDEWTAKSGRPTRSFNAGVAGMRPPEDSFYLEQILAHRPRNLRWVFIELAGIRAAVDPAKLDTVRAVYWHDLPRLLTMWRHATWSYSLKKPFKHLDELSERLGDFAVHLRLFGQNIVNHGRGATLLNEVLSTGPHRISRVDLGAKSDGWIAADRPQQMSAAETARYEEGLAERKKTPAREDAGDPVSQATLDRMVAKIREAGATPVFVVPPTTSKKFFSPATPKTREVLTLNFSNVQNFAPLFEAQHRLDSDHLNTAGSELFTREIVRGFIEKAAASR